MSLCYLINRVLTHSLLMLCNRLVVDVHAMDFIFNHVRSTYPREAFGVLLGYFSGDAYIVKRAIALEKGYSSEFSFSIDYREWLERVLAGVKQGLCYIGMYHSHPDAEPLPSTEDVHTMIQCPGEVWLIVGVWSDGRVEYAAYTIPGPGCGIARLVVEFL
ncbi:MAG: hypothetical protein DRJ40_11175 [Thermoprotei archaeon]|nr:MAG: hypothetical protein DRJ40_11175 [Thermoprotei archaeon]